MFFSKKLFLYIYIMKYHYKLEKYEYKMSNNNNIFYKQKFNYYKKLVGGFESINSKYIEILDQFIKSHNESNPFPSKQFIDESHGLSHMLTVLCHTNEALKLWPAPIEHKQLLKVKLAALLHDIDDSKYFPTSVDYQNARHILQLANRQSSESDYLNSEDIEDIIKMIGWVSSSKNGDTIPLEAIEHEYLLYPRYADRLEAIGLIGLERTLEYTLKLKKQGNPNGVLFLESTRRAKNEEELFSTIATEIRYKNYNGSSNSMIDHFYDKLLRLGVYPIRNHYFDTICQQRQKPLIDIVLYFGNNETIAEEELELYMKEYIENYKKRSHDCPQSSCMCGLK